MLFNLIIEYEVFAYLTLFSNIIGTFQKSTKKMLDIYILTGVFYLIDIHLIEVSNTIIYISWLGFSITVMSRVLIDNKPLKNKLIKGSPFLMIIIIYMVGFDIVGILTALGFLSVTLAKLQDNILMMRLYFILSSLFWLIIMFILKSDALMIFYVSNIILLFYQILKDNNIREKGILKRKT